MAEVKITKNMCYLFLDVSETINTDAWKPEWKRIDKSTIFDLTMNANENEMDYIAYETAVTEIDKYSPEISQEIAMYRGNPIYDFMAKYFYNLPVGDAVRTPLLVVFPPDSDGKMNAWQVQENRCVPTNFNPVDGKLTFTLKMGGNIEKGTATITGGAPTFVEATA